MIPTKFATASLPPSRQFEAWHDWYRPLFDTAARNPPEEGFRAKCSTWLLGALTVAQASAPAIWTARTRALIRRNPIDHWVITVGKRGTVELTTGNTCVSPGVGVPYVISLADEMETTKSNYSRLQFYLGRDGFHEIDSLLEASRAKALDTPGGRLLADYMALLARRLPALNPEEGAELAKAVEAMVAACLGPSADRLAVASKQLRLTLMERVRRSVRVNLRSPSLGPHQLCREAAISRTQLYRMLEGEGGVAHYIQRQRLTEGFAQLSDISNVLPVSRIAEMLCFADASGFSRAFRREFGMSPSDVRAASLAGLPVPPWKSAEQESIDHFSDCLRAH
jgi:AraC-like DNA-binding protein